MAIRRTPVAEAVLCCVGERHAHGLLNHLVRPRQQRQRERGAEWRYPSARPPGASSAILTLLSRPRASARDGKARPYSWSLRLTDEHCCLRLDLARLGTRLARAATIKAPRVASHSGSPGGESLCERSVGRPSFICIESATPNPSQETLDCFTMRPDVQLLPAKAADPRPVLVSGATGYVGGRLVPRLLAAGHAVRCLVRDARKLVDRPWSADPRVEIRQVDLLTVPGLVEAMDGCGAAFYLARSPAVAGKDAQQDRAMARQFSAAAAQARLSRIVYLGPLIASDIGRILASHAVPVTAFRAGLLIGSGSVAFEMLRVLVERLPIMVVPEWIFSECRPIGVRNVLEYLVQSLAIPQTIGMTLDIGGPESVTYAELMCIMAEQLRLPRRRVIPVPIQAPLLSALWIHVMTPIGYGAARPIVEELSRRVPCNTEAACRLLPLPLLTAREAIQLALTRVQEQNVTTAWSSAGQIPDDPDWSDGSIFVEERSIDLGVPPAALYSAICRAGGRNGWYAVDLLWRARGLVDRLVGGPGLGRGRRDPESLQFGDVVDFWRVTGLQRDREVTLRAEMKVPGVAELRFHVEPLDAYGATSSHDAAERAERSRLRLIARFRPRGLTGLAYWYVMLPFHSFLFTRMLKGISVTAQRLAAMRETT